MFRTRALTPLVAVLLGLTACSSDDPAPAPAEAATPTVASAEPSQPASEVPEPSETPTPVEASASPSASPSRSASNFTRPDVVLTDEQEAALDTVEEFFHYYDKALKDPSQPIQEISRLAEGDFLGNLNYLISTDADEGLVQRGVVSYIVREVDAVTTVDGEPWTSVIVCADLTEAKTVDTQDQDAVFDREGDFLEYKLRLRKDTDWVIPEAGNRWVESCS